MKKKTRNTLTDLLQEVDIKSKPLGEMGITAIFAVSKVLRVASPRFPALSTTT